MRRFSHFLRVMLVVGSLPVHLYAADGGVRFRSIADGLSEAESTHKPMLLFFTADWCHPCQDMKRTVFSQRATSDLIEGRLVPIEILDRRREGGENPSDTQTMFRWMAVHGFPTLIVCRPDGTGAIEKSGFSSPEDTIKFLRKAMARLRTAKKAPKARAPKSPA